MEEEEGPLEEFHRPVMVDEVLALLEPAREGLILDGTVGGGGHAEAILLRWPRCRLLAVDRDPEALHAARSRLGSFGERVRFLQMRFDRAMDDAVVRREGLDGALLDLGVSSRQLDAGARGFAFRPGVPLDMRMEGQEGGWSAAELLSRSPEEELARIFREYGEEPRARRLAREIVRRREKGPLLTSDDLVAALSRALGRSPSPRDKARIFQALRLAVNEELEALEMALPRIRDALRPGGVMTVISYHSLEDRLVKSSFREWSRPCVCPPGLPLCACRGEPLGSLLTRGPRGPRAEEAAGNPRARSARLRGWRRAA